MGKGELTRERIIEAGAALARQIGLEGLTIGGLATELGLSKSGLFGHFGSKEELQLRVLEAEAARFERTVFMPAIKQPRGEARLRALFENWIQWNEAKDAAPGGCLIVTATVEFDDRPGPLRDLVAREQKRLLDGIAQAAKLAIDVGQFRRDLDVQQFAFEVYGMVLSHHFVSRMQPNAKSRERARAAFDLLLANARTQA